MNRRNTLVTLVALGAAPLAARAQQSAKPARVAWFGFGTAEAAGHQVDAFKRGLHDLGYVEGKNVVFEIRWSMGRLDRVPDLTKELVALKPDAILSGSAVTARALQKATTTIPIVLAGIPDPVGGGFVKSLGQPGGNITGVSSLATDTSPKLLELLSAVLPKLARVAMLWNPSNATHAATVKNIQSAAQSIGVVVLLIAAQTPAEIEDAFLRMGRGKVGGLIVPADSLFMTVRRQVTELASGNRLPSIFAYREQAEAGGLMSYGASAVESYRRAATYVAKILKGAKPGDLPVEQATILELVVNLKTAKALGLTIPQSVLIRADEVIQ